VLYGAPTAHAAAAVLLYRGITLSVPVVLGALTCAERSVASIRPAVVRVHSRVAQLDLRRRLLQIDAPGALRQD
jgi:hypothetical protein